MVCLVFHGGLLFHGCLVKNKSLFTVSSIYVLLFIHYIDSFPNILVFFVSMMLLWNGCSVCCCNCTGMMSFITTPSAIAKLSIKSQAWFDILCDFICVKWPASYDVFFQLLCMCIISAASCVCCNHMTCL